MIGKKNTHHHSNSAFLFLQNDVFCTFTLRTPSENVDITADSFEIQFVKYKSLNIRPTAQPSGNSFRPLILSLPH